MLLLTSAVIQRTVSFVFIPSWSKSVNTVWVVNNARRTQWIPPRSSVIHIVVVVVVLISDRQNGLIELFSVYLLSNLLLLLSENQKSFLISTKWLKKKEFWG